MATTILARGCRPGVEVHHPIDGDLGHMGHDEHLTAKIIRKRQEEMIRRARLLNPRTRALGIPHDILNAQVAEKAKAGEADLAEDAFYAASATMQDQILQTMESMKATAARERQMDVVDFSLTNLRKEQRREYYLSDPNAIKNERLPDLDDPSLGPSSMQKFSSTGKDSTEVRKAGQRQQAIWLKEQMQEKADRHAQERAADNVFTERANMASQILDICEDHEKQEQRRDKVAEAEENLRLAEIVRARNKVKKDADSELKTRHLGTIRASEMYGELNDWKVGQTGKLIRTEYKRLSLEEEQDVYNSNARQMMTKQSKKGAGAAEDAEDAARIRCAVAVLGGLEEERERQTKERQMRITLENQRLAAAKKVTDVEERRHNMSWDM
ncbi:unnamed protein product [Polarella glacialis]|uniref:Uncharacterized protein n=3 Tax=Polarella glacialis TaxID=89957 RepID=A0A813HMF1_POLGL|nr:unnamed protein product [Polarella glacialis]|mmetsp:Transcript_24711/g.39589  ORF Transcript_24711/g.39589 Transcript_24711/m.39589 type:complete len:384 (-) Transcript_24711:176-1327(-)